MPHDGDGPPDLWEGKRRRRASRLSWRARSSGAIGADLKKLVETLASAPDKTNAALLGQFHSPEALSHVFSEEGEAVIYERLSTGDIKVLGRLSAGIWTDFVHDMRRAGTLAH